MTWKIVTLNLFALFLYRVVRPWSKIFTNYKMSNICPRTTHHLLLLEIWLALKIFFYFFFRCRCFLRFRSARKAVVGSRNFTFLGLRNLQAPSEDGQEGGGQERRRRSFRRRPWSEAGRTSARRRNRNQEHEAERRHVQELAVPRTSRHRQDHVCQKACDAFRHGLRDHDWRRRRSDGPRRRDGDAQGVRLGFDVAERTSSLCRRGRRVPQETKLGDYQRGHEVDAQRFLVQVGVMFLKKKTSDLIQINSCWYALLFNTKHCTSCHWYLKYVKQIYVLLLELASSLTSSCWSSLQTHRNSWTGQSTIGWMKWFSSDFQVSQLAKII